MSEIRPLVEANVGTELDNNSHNFGDELVGNSDFIKTLEVVVLRTIPRLLIPVFEPLIRRVVKEEIEVAQQRFSTSTNQNSGERAISPQLRKLKLRFRSKLSQPILTGKPILGEDGSPLKIELIDENTELIVKSGPESSARVEFEVLRVDPNEDEGREWTSEKFVQNIVKEIGKMKSLLNGKPFLNLKEGTGSVDKIYFSHGKKWTKRSDFMLGARTVNNYDGIIVTEAKSEHFTLEDCRSKLYKKHYPPFLFDEVWRLDNIRKGKKYNKRLNGEKIKTVKDFLIQFSLKGRWLQEILQMPDKAFDATVKHGLTCERNKLIYHPHNFQYNAGVIFDEVGQLLGILSDNGFISVDKLSDRAKVDAKISVESAFENWGDVARYYEIENSTPSSSTQLALPNFHIDASNINPLITPSMAIVSPDNPSTYFRATDNSAFDLDFEIQPSDLELLREYLKSPLSGLEPEGRVINDDDKIFDYSSGAEDSNDKEKHNWIRRWFKMLIVVKFLLRMRNMEKTDHVRKKMRIR